MYSGNKMSADAEIAEITNLMSGIFLTGARQVSDSIHMEDAADEMDIHRLHWIARRRWKGKMNASSVV